MVLHWLLSLIRYRNDTAEAITPTIKEYSLESLRQVMKNVNIVESTGSLCISMSSNPHPRPLFKPEHRIDQFNHVSPRLFVDGIETNDISQGAFGTCYFLAAMAYCAYQKPDVIQHAISATSNPQEFTVRLYDEAGQLHTCIVNTDVPYISLGEYACAKSKKNDEMWVSLLEKGFAQLVVNRLGMESTASRYEIIEGGWSAVAMTLLARGRSYYICVTDLVSKMLGNVTMMEQFCDVMIQFKAHGCSFFVAWVEEFAAKRDDLVTGHAYSVLAIKYILDCGYVFMLHNPWGQYEWKGSLSDSDKSPKSMAVHKAFNIGFKNDGFFLIGAHDFFARLFMLEIHEPHEQTIVRDVL